MYGVAFSVRVIKGLLGREDLVPTQCPGKVSTHGFSNPNHAEQGYSRLLRIRKVVHPRRFVFDVKFYVCVLWILDTLGHLASDEIILGGKGD